GSATEPPAVATKGTHTSPTGTARTRRCPSQRSIRSSPDRLNSANEPPISSGARRSTRSSTFTEGQRSALHRTAQFVQPQPDAALDRAQRQARLVGDLLV